MAWEPATPTDPITKTDEAVTFGESDVSVSHDQTETAAGSIELPDENASTADCPDSSDTTTQSDARGIEFDANSDLEGIEVTIATDVSGFTTAYVTDNNSNLIDSKDISNLSGGDTFMWEVSISSGTGYYLSIDADGSSYTVGRDTSPSYPYTSTHIDAVAGATNGPGGHSSTSNYHFNINDVKGYETIGRNSGNATVSWPSPDAVKSWDLATFQRTLDGETCTVDVVEEPYFPDDFEDGDISSWTNDTSNLTAVQSPSLIGSYSGELSSSGADVFVDSTAIEHQERSFRFSIQIDNDTGNSGDFARVRANDDNDNGSMIIDFEDGTNDIHVFNGSLVKIGTWEVGTTYNVECHPDWDSGEQTIYINGENKGTYSLNNNTGYWSKARVFNYANDSGASRNVYFDGQLEKKLFGNITKNFDISTIDRRANVRLQANLSRSNTSNNPTLDYAARRYER